MLSASGNAQVYATYHNTQPAEFPNASYHALNVLADKPDLSLLPDQLHGFVYCPGSINLKPFHHLTAEDFTQDYRLNVTGAITTLQAVLPRLKASEAASVVFFSTVAVQLGLNFHTQVAANKGAIEGLTRALAAELSPRIRVNCLAPSLTDTPLAAQLLSTPEKREASANRHPLKKIGQPEDIAAMAQFLLSNRTSFITGQILKVDGGMGAVRMA